MFKRIVMVACVAVMFLLSGCSSDNDVITLTTGGTGGTYYPIGGSIAQILSDHMPSTKVNGLVGNASVANCTLIEDGLTDMALVQNNVAYWAYEGIGAFKTEPVKSIRGIASLYPEVIQIVSLKESGIGSVEDLKGKRVGVGVLGSGAHFDVENILAVHDMTELDFDARYLTFTEAATKLKNNEIDAAFVTAGYPTSSVMDVNLARDIDIVPIAEDKIQKILETSPYYSSTYIPAGTYSGVEHKVATVTTMAMLVVSEDMPKDLVYDMTKTLWENRDVLAGSHEMGQAITIETALQGMGIPLHEGAQAYYREVGIE